MQLKEVCHAQDFLNPNRSIMVLEQEKDGDKRQGDWVKTKPWFDV